MKTIKLTLAYTMMLLTLIAGTLHAQQHVAVAVATGQTSCGTSNDLGYYWYSSPDEAGFNLRTKAVIKAKSEYPDFKYINSEVEYEFCTHMVIISARFTNGSCSSTMYGVGFADDRAGALENAVNNLKTRNWSWVPDRDGYTVSEEEVF